MRTEKIHIKKLDPNAVIPTYGTEFSAGADIYACMDAPVLINSQETVLIHTGIALEIPVGYVGLIFARSGLATKRGIAPANKVSVIDSDYRGELMVPLHNHSSIPQEIAPNERIAQMIFTPYLKGIFEETNELNSTERGTKGFGSTGKF